MNIPNDAFTITHCDSVLANATVQAGTNLLTNPGFETGALTGYATTTNWSAVASSSVTPNGADNYCAQAGSASKGQASTLESNRFAVSGSADYIARCEIACPSSAARRANNVKIVVRWFSAAVGGWLRDDVLWWGPVKEKTGGLRSFTRRLTSPSSATYVSFYAQNKFGGSAAAGKGIILDNPMIAGAVSVPTALTALDVWKYRADGIGFENLKYAWAHQTGCKKMTFRLRAPGAYLWNLMQNALGHHIETHYGAQRVFGGMLWSMAGRIGGRDMAISLDSLANFVKVPRGDTYEIQTNADSIARYGRKDFIAGQSFDTATDARSYGRMILNERAFPIPAAADGQGGQDDDYLDVEVMGYSAILQWVTDLPPVFVGLWDTADVLATMSVTGIGSRSLLGRLRSDTENDFLSDDYANVDDTGVTVGPLENTQGRTTLDMYLELVGRGDSNGRALVAGIDAERKLYLHARPTTVEYTRTRGSDGKWNYTDPTGTEIPRPLVRCGVWATDGAPTPSYMSVTGSDAARDPANKFVTEVEYDHEMDDVNVQFLGARRIGLDLAMAARKARK